MKSPRIASSRRSSSPVSRMSAEIGTRRGGGGGEDEHGAVDLAFDVELGDPVRDRLRVGVRRAVGEADVFARRLVAAEGERRAALLADGAELDLLAVAAQLPLERERPADDLSVERAGEAAVAGERDDGDGLLLLALVEQRQPPDGAAGAPDACNQRPHRGGGGARRLG